MFSELHQAITHLCVVAPNDQVQLRRGIYRKTSDKPKPAVTPQTLIKPKIPAVNCNRLLGLDQFIVFGMCANPKPNQAFLNLNGHSPIFNTDSYRSIPSYLFQVQGRMSKVFLQQFEIFVCQLLNISRKFSITLPKRRARKMSHSSLHLPARKSAIA